MKKFVFDTYYLNSREYAKIISEINTNYGKYEGLWFCVHNSYDVHGSACRYYFENRGYNDYNIYAKIER
ncbi:MAG: hypothetical protein J5783_00600 [Lachnospiraceae bacterium]|jgi:hypothetical protein|nr:hypothetical protein [Lachnospiraceae bacterium]